MNTRDPDTTQDGESVLSGLSHAPDGPGEYRGARGVVQAWRLTRENGPRLWEWADSKPFFAADGQVDGLSVYTAGGRMKAEFGDWIVRTAAGGFWPVPDGLFAATYERVDPDADLTEDGWPL